MTYSAITSNWYKTVFRCTLPWCGLTYWRWNVQTSYVTLLLLQHGHRSEDHSVEEYNAIMKVGHCHTDIGDHAGCWADVWQWLRVRRQDIPDHHRDASRDPLCLGSLETEPRFRGCKYLMSGINLDTLTCTDLKLTPTHNFSLFWDIRELDISFSL